MTRSQLHSRISLFASLVLLGDHAASAQTACYSTECIVYRIVDLGRIASSATQLSLPPAGNITFGINDGGAIVYVRQVGEADLPHAFIYVPRSMFGFAGRGSFDLHSLAELDADVSAAVDINETGVVVGSAGDGLPVEETARGHP